MALAPQERAQSIILEPSREGRRRTNELVRDALKKKVLWAKSCILTSYHQSMQPKLNGVW